MTPNKNLLYRKIILYVIGITLILLLILPFYHVFVPELTDAPNEYWKTIYLVEDEFLIIGLLPFYAIFLFYTFSKKKILKTIFKVILFLLAILYFVYALMTTQIPVMDYIPDIGTLLLFLLLPEFIYLHYMDMWVKYYEENQQEATTKVVINEHGAQNSC